MQRKPHGCRSFPEAQHPSMRILPLIRKVVPSYLASAFSVQFFRIPVCPHPLRRSTTSHFLRSAMPFVLLFH